MYKMYKLWLVNKETGKKTTLSFEAMSLEKAIEYFRNGLDYDIEEDYDIVQVMRLYKLRN